jgi:ribosomal protein S14
LFILIHNRIHSKMFSKKFRKYLYKDYLRRNLYNNIEKKKRILTSLFKNRSLSFKLRFSFFLEISNLKKNSSLVRIQNRCIFSGHKRSVYKIFRINRMQLKDLAFHNLIPALKQANW